MYNELFRGDDLRFLRSYQILQEYIAGDKEVTLIGATENENVIRVCQPIPQSPYSWEQSFSLCEIYWQHSQMVSDLFELRPTSGIRSQKQFLKHNWVNGEANAAIRFRGKHLCRRRVTPEVADNHVCVQGTRVVDFDQNVGPVRSARAWPPAPSLLFYASADHQ
jgi:hypothetical protein